jgi:hypothetical protein
MATTIRSRRILCRQVVQLQQWVKGRRDSMSAATAAFPGSGQSGCIRAGGQRSLSGFPAGPAEIAIMQMGGTALSARIGPSSFAFG